MRCPRIIFYFLAPVALGSPTAAWSQIVGFLEFISEEDKVSCCSEITNYGVTVSNSTKFFSTSTYDLTGNPTTYSGNTGISDSLSKITLQTDVREKELKRNAIYGTVGNLIVWLSATGYYERIISQKNNLATFIKVGFGYVDNYGVGSPYLLAQYGILTGSKKHHFELGAGPNLFLGDNSTDDFPLSATLGWRRQKPGGNFLLRAGVSFPEAIYFGFGVAF